MKKFFQNLALAVLAIAGILASSCKVEDIHTTFEPTKAVATITVTAKDALHGNADISKDPALKITASSTAGSAVSVNGNVLTIEGDPFLRAQTVTIDAEYNGVHGQASVNVNSLLSGGKASYGATVIIGVPINPVATAHVMIAVWDNESEKDVTAEAVITAEGVPTACTIKEGSAKGTFVITSDEDIAAFDLKVKATYNEAEGSTTVNVGKIARGDSKFFAGAIALGEAKKIPAKALIHVVVVDGISEEDITDDCEITASLPEGSTATVEVKDGVVIVTAGEDLKIAAQTVTINVKYDDLEETVYMELAELAEGVNVEFGKLVVFKNPASYYPVKVSETTEVTFGEFFSTHNLHMYTHDYSHEITHDYGHAKVSGNWLYNETEFILETTVEYDKMFGTKGVAYDLSKAETSADKAVVKYYGEALKTPWVVTKEILDIKVSAFARYSAFGTKITTTLVYDVKRDVAGDDVVVGTITLTNIATQAEYVEASIPGHEGHYHYGHGHADEHGYSSNAGGGILWAE